MASVRVNGIDIGSVGASVDLASEVGTSILPTANGGTGVATTAWAATSLALGGATIGTNALAVTGTSLFGTINITDATTSLSQLAANSLALRSSGTASNLYLQNSVTGSTATDGLALQQVSTETYFWNYEAGSVHFATSNVDRWDITALGHLVSFADNSYDIGASGATRPRTGYFGTSVICAGTVKGTLTTITAATTGLGAGVVAALTNATLVITDSTGQVYRVPAII